jgi:hypothetical protein
MIRGRWNGRIQTFDSKARACMCNSDMVSCGVREVGKGKRVAMNSSEIVKVLVN